jgi:homoserine/homoserine lactone efflux protein
MISMSPGASSLICMNHSLEHGMRRTSITIVGLEIGNIIIFLLASVGLGAALLSSEYIFLSIKIAGALYLIHLGVMQWRASIRAQDSIISISQSPAKSNYKLFATGLLTNLSNPKGIIFMVAMLPQFINQTESLSLQLLIMSVTMVSVDSFVMHIYSLIALSSQELLQSPRVMQWRNRIFGSMLIAIGTTLFFVNR